MENNLLLRIFSMHEGIGHVRITRHRPATNGIAERFVRRLKEMLAEREGYLSIQ